VLDCGGRKVGEPDDAVPEASVALGDHDDAVDHVTAGAPPPPKALGDGLSLPPVVSGQHVIGVDVGGTKILAARVLRDGSVPLRRERPTITGSQAELIAELEAAVEELLDDDVAAIGFGVPSQIDQKTGTAYGSVNIPLHNIALRDHMEQRFSLPVGIENDGNAAAFAEWAFGAGRGSDDMVMITLGTGVGGGVVIGRRLYRGWAELGHVVVVFDGKPCQGRCTGRGHLESYCTGVAAGDAAEEAFGPGTDAHRLVRIAREGDKTAIELLAGIGRLLGAGIGSFVNIFDPQIVVVGGGFGTAAGDFLLGPAHEIVRREALEPAGEDVQLVNAKLGTAAGVIGAGLIAFEALDASG
jgi:glucokinase